MSAPKRKVPTYQVIAGHLLELITSGKVAPGERLPKEAELVERYRVTRPTVRQAYRVLIDDGHVLSLSTSGYFVRGTHPRRWVLRDQGRYVDPWARMVLSDAGVPREETAVELVTTQQNVADYSLAEWFETPGEDQDDEVVSRSALRTLDNEPVMLATTYIPAYVAEGTDLRRPKKMDLDAVTFLTERHGGNLCGVTDTITSRAANDKEVRLLELPESTKVMEVVRQVRFGSNSVLVVERLVVDVTGARFVNDDRTPGS